MGIRRPVAVAWCAQDSGKARVLRAVEGYRGATRSWAIYRTQVATTRAAVRRRDVATVVAEALFSVEESPVAQRGCDRATSQVMSVWKSQREDS